jgi:hypothetical protein
MGHLKIQIVIHRQWKEFGKLGKYTQFEAPFSIIFQLEMQKYTIKGYIYLHDEGDGDRYS